nr:hypothetical protein [Shewanella holmiensis]
MNIDEGLLIDNTKVSTVGQLAIQAGSDDVTAFSLADNFNFGNYSSLGQTIVLSEQSDINNWYNAIRTGDNGIVFRVRFNANGQVEFEQFLSIDHPQGNNENTLTMSFDVFATDADGDITNNQTINVIIKDDVPIAKDSTLTFTEGREEQYSITLFNQNQQGADGASVTKFVYGGLEYQAGDTVDLYTDTGERYATLVISQNGIATVTSHIFDYPLPLFSEVIPVYVTDSDGDTVIDNLTIIAKDQTGSIKVLNPHFVEDTIGDLRLAAFPGDLDVGEAILSIVITTATLGGGTLTLNGAPLPKDSNGNYILQDDDLYIDDITGIAIPSGTLQYHPAEDESDATSDINIEFTVNINNKPPVTTTVGISIESVADAPIWQENSQFEYSVNEDSGNFDIHLEASSKDLVGNDSQGSEILSFKITNISSGLTLQTINSNGQTINITDGQSLSAAELANLKAITGDNLAGQFTFNVQASTTEPDNGDINLGSVETVTINVKPIADTPTLITRDINSIEDSAILLSSIISGELTDNSGSESLYFEFTLPDGWSLDAPSATNLGNGVWTVSAADLAATPPATLIPPADVSSANFGVFSIQVRSFALETTQDGIDPNDTIILPNPHYSEPQTLTIHLSGVANDAPTIASDSSTWTIVNGNITNVNSLYEDNDIPLDFTIISSDIDGSESLSIRIMGLPDDASFVNSNGETVNLAIIGFEANQPIYSVTSEQLSALSIRPPKDYSGPLNLVLFIESTELDGDNAEYQLNLNINIRPVIDETSNTLKTLSSGREDQPIVLNLLPALLADIDGSESVTGLIIQSLPTGMVLLLDGSQIIVGVNGLDLSTLTDENSPTLLDLLQSGRIAVLPPQDADGVFHLDAIYEITDRSESGQTEVTNINTQLDVNVDAVVEVITRFQLNQNAITSHDGSPITLTNEVVFFDGDIDGSETLQYIVITMPEADGWFVTHPNGAIHDGDGRWLIPNNNLTNDTTQEQYLAILDGMTISSDHATQLAAITIEARILDRDDADVISTTLLVTFTQPTSNSQASNVNTLQLDTVDATEDQVIDFSSHFNKVLTNDPNDIISFRILASDLPEGGYFTGSDVIALYDSTGQYIIEYVFTSASLANLQLHNISDNFSGDMVIPIRIIATDSASGDTFLDDSQSIDINITPIADTVELQSQLNSIKEDTPVPLGLSLIFTDQDLSAQDGGVENIVLGDSNQAFSITLLDGGSIIDPSGLFQLQVGTTDTWEFTGTNQTAFHASLALLQFSPPTHLSGNFRIQVSGTIDDSADIDGNLVHDYSAFSDTITIYVEPVTDSANIPNNPLQITGEEDSEIALSGLSSSNVGLIDQDGSEIIYMTLNGLPEGATVFVRGADGTLHILPNNGPDGGQLNGQPTLYWTVSVEHLDSLVIKPPQNFNGDLPLTLNIITQELGTNDFVTTSTNILVGVTPVADGAQIIQEPASNLNFIEGEIISVDFHTELLDLSGHEQMQVDITITSSQASALVDLQGIQIGNQYVALVPDGNGGFTASLVINASSLTHLDILPGDLAFGTLQVSMDISSIDNAQVLGTSQTSISTAQTVSFDVELTPEVDSPIWTYLENVISNTPNAVLLQIEAELQNPAPGEVGQVIIYDLPSHLTLSAGSQNGDHWIIALDELAGLTILGASNGENFNLRVVTQATLNGETATGDIETINVDINTMNPASSYLQHTELRDWQLDIIHTMHERMMHEHQRDYSGVVRFGNEEFASFNTNTVNSISALSLDSSMHVSNMTKDEPFSSEPNLTSSESTFFSSSLQSDSVQADYISIGIVELKLPKYGITLPPDLHTLSIEPIADIDNSLAPEALLVNWSLYNKNMSIELPPHPSESISEFNIEGKIVLLPEQQQLPGFGYVAPILAKPSSLASNEESFTSDKFEIEQLEIEQLSAVIKQSIQQLNPYNSFSLQENTNNLSIDTADNNLDELNQLMQQQALINS